MLSRLFPFARGLVHYYWASNAWALHMFCNKYIVNILKIIETGHKVELQYEAEDVEYFKKLSGTVTLCFLVVSLCLSKLVLLAVDDCDGNKNE